MIPAIENKRIPWKELPSLAKRLHEKKLSVVSTNGCFDLLHWGHLRYLAEAKGLGDVLVVGLNSDSSVRKLKGASRPIFPEEVRARQLASLSAVDYVVTFEEETPLEFLRILRPGIHVKGADYRNKPLPERQILENWGGRIELLPMEEGFSTTHLIKRLKSLSD